MVISICVIILVITTIVIFLPLLVLDKQLCLLVWGDFRALMYIVVALTVKTASCWSLFSLFMCLCLFFAFLLMRIVWLILCSFSSSASYTSCTSASSVSSSLASSVASTALISTSRSARLDYRYPGIAVVVVGAGWFFLQPPASFRTLS